jgi:hypothetical protein
MASKKLNNNSLGWKEGKQKGAKKKKKQQNLNSEGGKLK